MILNQAELELRHMSHESLVQYGQAVQLIAGAGSRMSFAEVEVFYEMAKLRGVPETIVSEWKKFEVTEHDIVDVLCSLEDSLTDKTRRLLVLDAVRTASADGVYPHEEEEAVRKAAEALGLDEKEVVKIEILASLEKNVRDIKNLLFDG